MGFCLFAGYLAFINRYSQVVLSVCPQHVIVFCNCSCPLLDGQKWLPLDVTIPTHHHLSSTDQIWRSYWSLIWPETCENWKFWDSIYFSPSLVDLSCSTFSGTALVANGAPEKSGRLGPFWILRNKIAPHGKAHFPIQIQFSALLVVSLSFFWS